MTQSGHDSRHGGVHEPRAGPRDARPTGAATSGRSACVLFEMLTGKRAFAGDDVSDTLAAILMREPDWSRAACGSSSTASRSVVQRCLQKDPRRGSPISPRRVSCWTRRPGFSLCQRPLSPCGVEPQSGWKAASVVAAGGDAGARGRVRRPLPREAACDARADATRGSGARQDDAPEVRRLAGRSPVAFYAVGSDGGGSVWVHSFDSGESRRWWPTPGRSRRSPGHRTADSSRFPAAMP